MIASSLASLFPDGVAAFETGLPGDPADLYPEEAACVARAVPKRVQEFAAGRSCARMALAALGYGAAPLPVRPDRRPAWPEGVRGSISHTAGLCAAVAAPASRLAAIGIDVERDDRLGEELWRAVFTPDERAAIESRPRGARAAAAALMFSAKEAFFKCQFELTGRWLEFAEVEVALGEGEFSIALQRDDAAAGPVYRGRFVRRPPFVCTGCYVEARHVR